MTRRATDNHRLVARESFQEDEIAIRETIRNAIEGLARIMARSPDDHADAVPAFHLLTAMFLNEISDRPKPWRQRRQETLLRLVELERQMKGTDAAERRAAARERLGISRSYWYQLIAEGIEIGLIQESESARPLSTE